MLKRAGLLLVAVTLLPSSGHAEAPVGAEGVLAELSDRMYAIGETSGKPEQFDSAIVTARDKIRALAAAGDISSLTAKDKSGATPLIKAAYLGYAGIVEELLSYKPVADGLDQVDSHGYSAWTYANFDLRESAWICNPPILTDPFKIVPMMVEQPYYQSGPEPPYMKLRRLLVAAGAKPDMADAKQQWLSLCTAADPDARRKVEAADDLLLFLRSAGAEKLKSMQKPAATGFSRN